MVPDQVCGCNHKTYGEFDWCFTDWAAGSLFFHMLDNENGFH